MIYKQLVNALAIKRIGKLLRNARLMWLEMANQ